LRSKGRKGFQSEILLFEMLVVVLILLGMNVLHIIDDQAGSL
jgi:hypothetical protein